MSKKPLVPQNIEDLKPYIPGKTIAEVKETYQPEKISKLASNENRLGCSPLVDEAVQKAVKKIQDYPDPISRTLKSALAAKYGVNENKIIVGAGSESLMSVLFRTFFHNKQNLITADATFIGIYVQAQIRGVKVKKIPLTNNYRFDVRGIVNAIDEHTKMIYIANPNNPTGTYITKSEFEYLMEKVPEEVLVVMDEAYIEFAISESDYPNALDYSFDNLIILRTFSKAYGLAGFRIGYGFGSDEVIRYMHKTKLTFEPTATAQAAALASLKDQEFLSQSIEMVSKGRDQLYSFFDNNDIKYIRSIANFVVIVLPDEESASFITQKMMERGVILRQISSFGLPNCIRITIGMDHEIEHFKKEFIEVIKLREN